MSGWALQIRNNKDFNLIEVTVTLNKIRVDQNITSLSKLGRLYRLGYIDRRDGEISEEVVTSSSFVDVDIPRKTRREFVLTEIIKRTSDRPTIRKFITYPNDDIGWPFVSDHDDAPLGNSPFSTLLASTFINMGKPVTHQPTVVIEVEVTGKVKTEDEIIILPIMNMNVEVMSSGALSFYGDDKDEDEHENQDND